MAATADVLLRRWFEELWNQGRVETIDQMLAPNSVVHGLTPDDQPVVGPAAFKEQYWIFRKAFPDMRINVVRSVVQGNLGAVHCEVRGRHTGDTLGPPSNREVAFQGMVFVKIDGEKFVEGWNSFDFMTMYQQIGLLPQVKP